MMRIRFIRLHQLASHCNTYSDHYRVARCGQFTPSKAFEDVKKFIRSGALGKYDYADMLESLEGDEGFGKADYFLVGKDFPDYVECQERIDKAYRNQEVRPHASSLLSSAPFTPQSSHIQAP